MKLETSAFEALKSSYQGKQKNIDMNKKSKGTNMHVSFKIKYPISLFTLDWNVLQILGVKFKKSTTR